MRFARGNAHALEDRLARRRAAHPHLVLEPADRQPGPVGLDEERRDPARPGHARVGEREHDVGVGDAGVRDPVLRPVDDPLVAVLAGSRADRAGIGARFGLRQRERGQPLAARHARQGARLELVRAGEPDRQRAEVLHGQQQRGRGAGLGDLLDRDAQHQRPGAGPAVGLVEGQPEEVVVGEQAADVLGELAARVDLRGARRDALAHDLADDVAKLELLVGQPVERDVGGDDAHRQANARARSGA